MYFSQTGRITTQMTHPARAIASQLETVTPHPALSVSAANQKLEIALPTYVKALTTPEMVEILPNFMK